MSETRSETLADALPKEIERVRYVRDLYKGLEHMPNVIVKPQIAMMDHAINEAVKSCAAGDTVAMLRWYEELQGWVE